MKAKESLLKEIEQIPESLLPEVLEFIQYLKYKHYNYETTETKISYGYLFTV